MSNWNIRRFPILVNRPKRDTIDIDLFNAPLSNAWDGDAKHDGRTVRWVFLESDAGITSAISRAKLRRAKWIKGPKKYTYLGVTTLPSWLPFLKELAQSILRTSPTAFEHDEQEDDWQDIQCQRNVAKGQTDDTLRPANTDLLASSSSNMTKDDAK